MRERPLRVVGVDGCKRGWFFVALGDGATRWGVSPDASALLAAHRAAELVLIDIPVGLQDRGPEERSYDKAARALLGRRGSSVFPAPSRPALTASSYAEALRRNRAATGRGLSRQSWAIAPKIHEVDALLRSDPGARARVREVHPEVCFWAMNCGAPMAFRKKSAEGWAERAELLARWHPPSARILREIGPRPASGVARDDVMDALCLAVSGAIAPVLRSLPEAPEHDAHGLPMEIAYPVLPATPLRPTRSGS